MTQITPIIQFVIIAILAIYATALYKSKLSGKLLRRSAVIILSAGVVLYLYAFSLEDYSEGPVTLFFRSLILSVKLFLYDGDLVEVHHAQRIPLFLDLYYLTFYAAMLTSFSAIIMLFGKRLMTHFILSFRKKKFKHVFLGINKRSEMIAKGLNPLEVAFIEFPAEDSDEEVSIKKALKNVSSEDNNNEWFRSSSVTILRASRSLNSFDASGSIFAGIGLARLGRLIDADTSFYFLSENSEKNLNDLLVFVSDEALAHNTVHACVDRDGLSKSYQLSLAKTGAHFIFPSSLSVVELMKDQMFHPSSVMEVNREPDGKAHGTVCGEFNALVIGFGETGQAVTKFLYEFSSAITSDGKVLPVHIFINDYRLDRLKGQFVFSSPDMEHGDILVYENFGLDSGKFWDTLLQRLDILNYIEISMKEDAVNLALACYIFSYAMKKRKNGFDNFRIVVRKRFTPTYEKAMIDALNEKAGKEVIFCYGEYEKIFTSEMIVSKSSSGINHSATSIADKLQSNFAGVRSSAVSSLGKTDSYREKRRRRMEMHQFISRANHIPTKLAFTGGSREPDGDILENLARCEHLRYKRYLLAHGYSFGPEDDDSFKTNHQICDWDSLAPIDKQYHRDIVKASLM